MDTDTDTLLEFHIRNILEGHATLLTGAGAAYGAKNLFDKSFPSGEELAKELYEKCGELDFDKPDLKDASQLFISKYSKEDLISFLIKEFTVKSWTNAHETIYTLPWKRHYTTNYDNIPIFAASEQKIDIIPFAFSSEFNPTCCLKNCCIHINGCITNLTTKTLDGEFRLTVDSYLSKRNYVQEAKVWEDLLKSDLDTSDSIIIIGLSLDGDLDIARILYSPEIKSKVLIIDSNQISQQKVRTLSKYGTLRAIGIDKFAELIEKEKIKIKPIKLSEKKYELENFVLSDHSTFSVNEPSKDEIYNFYKFGDFSDNLIFKRDRIFTAILERHVIHDILTYIKQSKKVIFLHSRLGNGKTTLLNIIEKLVSAKDIAVYTHQSKLIEIDLLNDISILTASPEKKKLIIIDDYSDFMHVIDKFKNRDLGNISLLLAARSAINSVKMYDVLKILNIRPGESTEVCCDKLNDEELKKCCNIFSQHGLFGENSNLSTRDKIKLLSAPDKGNASFQNILVEIAKSKYITEKIQSLLKKTRDTSIEYYNTILFLFINQVMKLQLNYSDIDEIFGYNIVCDAGFQSDESVLEFLQFREFKHPKVVSAATSKFILDSIHKTKDVINILYLIAKWASKYEDKDRYKNILKNLASYSQLISIAREQKNTLTFLSYYEKLSDLTCFRKNHFFWLQYSIAATENKKFDRAQTYIDNAYSFIKDKPDFIPFQIDNHQARLYLERIEHNASDNVEQDFTSAHKILMQPIVSEKDKETKTIKILMYYSKVEIHNKMVATKRTNEIYKEACKYALKRLGEYSKKYPHEASIYNRNKFDLIKYSVTE